MTYPNAFDPTSASRASQPTVAALPSVLLPLIAAVAKPITATDAKITWSRVKDGLCRINQASASRENFVSSYAAAREDYRLFMRDLLNTERPNAE